MLLLAAAFGIIVMTKINILDEAQLTKRNPSRELLAI